jgi:hypothetical protein
MHGAVRCADFKLSPPLLVTNKSSDCWFATRPTCSWAPGSQSPDVYGAISPSEQQHRVVDADDDPSVPSPYITSQPASLAHNEARYHSGVWYEHVVAHTDNTMDGWSGCVPPSAYGQEQAMMTAEEARSGGGASHPTAVPPEAEQGRCLRAYPSRPASAATHLAGRDSDGPDEPRSVQSRRGEGPRRGTINSNHRGSPAVAVSCTGARERRRRRTPRRQPAALPRPPCDRHVTNPDMARGEQRRSEPPNLAPVTVGAPRREDHGKQGRRARRRSAGRSDRPAPRHGHSGRAPIRTSSLIGYERARGAYLGIQQ